MANKRIKDLTNTATDADIASGNYFALDGSAGTKKLNSTTLLTKTAQNALGSIRSLSSTATDFASDDYIALDGATNGSRKMSNDSLLDITRINATEGINYAFLNGGEVEFEDTTDGHGIDYTNGSDAYESANLSTSDFITCFGATSIKFLDYVGTISTNIGFAFYDENKQYISGGSRSIGDSEGAKERSVNVPDGAYFFRTTYWSATKASSLGVDDFYAKVQYEGLAGKESIEELKISIGTENVIEVEKINAIDSAITYNSVVNCTTGVTGYSDNFDVCEFSLPELAQFVKIPIFCRTQDSKLSGFAFYDKDGTYISGDGTYSYYATADIYAVVEIPDGAKTIAVSVSKTLTLSSVDFVCYRAGGTKKKTIITYGNNDCCDGYYAYMVDGSISNAWSSNFGMFEKIPCKGAYKLIAKIPVYNTTPGNGIAFYDELGNYIVGRNRKQDTNGSEVVDIMIPTNAAFVSVLAWNYNKQTDNGGVPYVELHYIGDKSSAKREKKSGQIHFSVIVDQSVANWWKDDGDMNSPSLAKSTCVLTLPDDYTPNGKPCKLMVWCHGNSRNVSLAQWGLNNVDYLAQKERFRAAGYAVLDCNGPRDNSGSAISYGGCPQGVMAYLKAINYAVENYNLDPIPYIVGASAGGFTASSLSAIIPTKCLCYLSPNLSHKTWWDVGNPKQLFVDYFGFDDTTTWEEDKAVGWDIKSKIVSGAIPAVYPRVMLFVGDAETAGEFWQDMQSVISAIRSGGGFAGLHVCLDADHGITNGQFPAVDQQVIDWLDRF